MSRRVELRRRVGEEQEIFISPKDIPKQRVFSTKTTQYIIFKPK